MQVVILAGGKGTRLRPYTTIFPKPLMPLGDYPILEIVIRQLKYYGIKDIIIAVGHLKELIEAYFHNGEKWGVHIEYSLEDKPLGTSAPLKLINGLQERFLVMNGDVLTSLDYRAFMDYHTASGACCTISMYRKPQKIDLGILEVNDDNTLYDYVEKPVLQYNVSMGVYAFNREILDYIPDNAYFDFPDLIKTLLKDNRKVVGCPFDGLWFDIGRPEDYEAATEMFEKHRNEILR